MRITGVVRRVGCVAFVALALVTCRDDPTGPKHLRAWLSVAPVLPASASNLAAFGLSVDSVRVVVVRPPIDTVADTTVFFPPGDDSIALALPIVLEAPSELMDLTVELRGGGFVLFSGTSPVDVHVGPASNTQQPTINLTFTGPGANITSISVTPLDSVIRLGDSLRFKVDALAGTTPVTLFYVAWSTSNAALAPINAHGVLTAPPARGKVTVTATTPTGISGSTPITFVPVPTSIVLVAPLPPVPAVPPLTAIGPLRVKVLALDGLGVKGVPVTFQATSGGGSVANALVVTDDSGYAQTGATVGATGTSIFSASAAGVASPVLFNFIVLSVGATQLAYTSQPGTTVAGTPIGPLTIELRNAQGNIDPGATNAVTIALGANPGGATLLGTKTVNAVAGIATFSGLSLTKASSGYTLVVSATGLTGATSTAFDIAAAAASQLAIVTQPTAAIAGTPFPAAVAVHARDAFGNFTPTFLGQVTIALGNNPAGGTLTGGTTLIAEGGIALFANLIIDNPGTGYTLVATATGLTQATSAAFNVIAPVSGRYWIAAAGGNWSSPANWSGGIVPGPNDTVFVTLGGTYTVTFDVNATVAFLFAGGGSGTQTFVANSRTLAFDSSASFSDHTALSLTNTTINLSTTGALVTAGGIAAQPGTSQINGSLFLNTTSVLSLNGNNGNASLQAGDLVNLGTIQLTGTSWGGQLTVTTGALLNAPGGVVHVLGGVSHAISGTFENQGTVQVDGPWTLLGADANHFNSGTIALTGGDWTLAQSGTTPSFVTDGTVIVGAGRTWNISGGLVDYTSAAPGGLAGNGTINFNGVTLDLNPNLTEDTLSFAFTNSTVNGPGDITVAAGATLNLTNTTINTSLVNNGTIQANPGSSTLTGGFSNEAGAMLRLSGNNGNANLAVQGGFGNQGTVELTGTSWGGQLSTSGTLINISGAQLHIVSGASNSLTGTLTNNGLVLIEGPFTLAGGGAHHTNGGTVAVSTADWVLNQSGTTPSFTTSGTINIAVGRAWNVNGGALTYQSGAIAGKGVMALTGVTLGLGQSFTHDTLALSLTSTTVNGPGTLTVAGATTLAVTNSIVNAPLVNQGTIQSNPGTNTLNGAFSNQAGSLLRVLGNNGNANLQLALGFTNQGAIELTGTSWGGNIATNGILVNAATGQLRVINGVSNSITGTLDNQGTIQVDGPWSLNGAGADHANSGTIAVSGADWILNQTGTTPTFNTTGTVTIAAGRTWSVNGGDVNYQAGAIAGKGTVSLSGVTLGLGLSFTHDTLALGLVSTTVNGPGTLTVAGASTLSVSNSVFNTALVNQGTIQSNPGTNTLNGAFSNQAGSLLRLPGNNGNANLQLALGFTNQGAIELTGTSWGGNIATNGTLVNGSSGQIRVINGVSNSLTGTLDNQGSVQIDGPFAMSGLEADHQNSGSIAVNSGAWTLTQTGVTPSFTTTGAITIGAATQWTVNGGAVTYQAGSLGGRGFISLNNTTLGLGQSFTHDTLRLTLVSSIVNGPGALTVAGISSFQVFNSTINAAVANQGTILVNPGASAFTGVFTNQPGAKLQVLGNNGTANLAVAGFTNQGTIELTGTSWGGALNLTSGALVNATGGVLHVVGGVGNSLTGALDNQGSVQVDGPWTLAGADADHLNSGTIALTGGDWTVSQTGGTPSFTNNGTITTNAARTFAVTGGSFVNATTGSLAGSGIVNVSATTFTQNGGVSPGGSPGELLITGSLPSTPASVLNVEIGGTLPTQFDLLRVSGNAALDGTLNVTLVNGFTPTIGNVFTIVIAGSRTGTFSVMNLPTVPGAVWLPTFTTTDVQLSLVSASALLPVLWTNPAGGSWNTGANWSTGTPPGPGDSAVINLVSTSFTVTLDVNTTVGFLNLGGGIGGPTWTLVNSANTLTLNKGGLVSQAGIINLSGGTLGGGGTIALQGTLNWSGGTVTGAGALDVAAGGTLNLSSAAVKTLNAKTIHNAGTVVWSGGNLSSGLGAALINQSGGALNVQGDVAWFYNLGGAQPHLDNQAGATITRSAGAGVFRLDVPFDNAGAVNVQSGSLELRGGGTSTADYAIAAGATLDWVAGSPVFGAGADITGAGTARLIGGVVNFEAAPGTSQVPKLYVQGGTLQGAGNLDITDSLVWTGGVMTGTGQTRINAGADLLINGAVTFSSRTIANGGTVLWTGAGNIATGSGAVLRNDATGVLNLQANASWLYSLGGAISHIANQPGGQVVRSVGTGTLDVRGALDNNGSVAVQTGTLVLSGGGISGGTFTVATPAVLSVNTSAVTFGATSSITGAGAVTFAGGSAAINGIYDVNGLTSVAGGVANFAGADTARMTSLALSSGTLGGSGIVLVRSSGTWSGGTMADGGVLRVPVGVTLNITGAVTLNGHQLSNAGQVLWSAGNISSGSGAVLNNTGLFEARPGASWFYNLGGAIPAFNNNAGGTLRRNTTNGTTTFNVPVTNAGTLDVQLGTVLLNSGATTTGTQAVAAGATLQYAAGTHSWGTNVAFTGAGRVLVQGTAIVKVDASAPDTVDANWIELVSGTLGGAGILRMKDSLVWSGGTVADAGILRMPVGARLAIRAGSHTFTERAVEVAGVVLWTGVAPISSGSNASLRLESGSLFQLESDAGWSYTLGGAVPHIDNLAGGTIKRGTATSAIVVGAVFNNDGLLDIQTGTVTFTNGGNGKGAATISSGAALGFDGGTHTWSGGSSITGSGTFAVNSGVVNLGGIYNVSGLTKLTGGTTAFGTPDTARITSLELSSPGVLGGTSAVLINGSGLWTGGIIAGSGSVVIPATRSLVMSGTVTKQLSGRSIATFGTLSWTGGQVSGLGGVVTINNGATLGVETDATWATGTTINILQGGVLKRSVGTGLAQFTAVVNNNGTIDASTGTLGLNGGGSGSGTFLASGTLDFSGGIHTLSGGAKINGTGLVNVGGGTVSLAGTGSSFDVTGTTQVLSGSLTLNMPDTARFTTLQLRGGTLTGSTNMVVRGSGSWTGGLLAAPTGLPGGVHLRVPPGVILTISGTATKQISVRTLLDQGTVNWVNGGMQSSNSALLDVQTSAVFNVSAPSSWSGQGTIQIADRANMNVTTGGATSIGSGTALDILGTLDIAAGATLKMSGDFNLFANGVLQGNGTLDAFQTTKIVNQGTLRPGTSPGVLTIVAPAAGWDQRSGNLVIDIEGTLVGTNYDQLAIVGSITLGGTLVVNRPFIGARLTTYDIVTATTGITGDFATNNLGQLTPLVTLTVDLNSTPKRVFLLQQ